MNLHQALALLELPPTATLSDAKASYKRLAKLHHPDKSDRADADEMFKAIGAAFALVQAHHALNGGEMVGTSLALLCPPYKVHGSLRLAA